MSRDTACFILSRGKIPLGRYYIILTSISSTVELLLNDTLSIVLDSPKDPDKLREQLAEVFSRYDIKPATIPEGHPDLQEKINLFLAGKRLEGLSDVTLESYALELRIFSEYVQKPTIDITTADLRVFLGQFKSLKTSSISKKLSVLKSFFSWLTSEDILLKDPSRRIKPPKQEKRLPKALTIEELEMLRENCRTLRQRALCEALYATGCRLSEVHRLNKEDIDWQGCSTRVIGKGDKEREVFFSPRAIYHLRKYLMSRLDNESALFVTERQPIRRLSRRGIQREIGIIAQNAALSKKVSPHTLRHTFASLTLNNGADLTAIQALLGHSDPATTQIYAQITDQKKREEYRKHLVL